MPTYAEPTVEPSSQARGPTECMPEKVEPAPVYCQLDEDSICQAKPTTLPGQVSVAGASGEPPSAPKDVEPDVVVSVTWSSVPPPRAASAVYGGVGAAAAPNCCPLFQFVGIEKGTQVGFQPHSVAGMM